MKGVRCDNKDNVTALEDIIFKEYLEDLSEAISTERNKGNEFSCDPTTWLKKYCSADHLFGNLPKDADHVGWFKNSNSSKNEKLSKFDVGTLYVLLVSGVLRLTLKYEEEYHNRRSEKRLKSTSNDSNLVTVYTKDTEETEEKVIFSLECHPIWIVAALVTPEHLERVEDPIKISLKLRVAIRKHCMDSEMNMCKDVYYDYLRKVPRKFVESLLNECVRPEETESLMDIQDMNVLFDLQGGKFRDIAQRPTYKKLYQEEVFWVAQVYEGFLKTCLSSFRRLLWLLLWNILYPLNEVCKRIPCLDECYRKRVRIRHRQLFSPISCFIADIVNYFIMIALIAGVMLSSRPDQTSTKKIVSQYLQGNLSLGHPRLVAGNTEGIILVELERNPFSNTACALALCLLSRILIECYQMSSKHIWTIVPEQTGFIPARKKVWIKLGCYLKSDMNKVDLLLMGFLLFALGIDMHYSFDPHIYGKVCVNKTACGEGFDYSLEARRVIYMTNFYSFSLLLTLVRLFYCLFLFVPIIGPILRSMQKMILDVIKVVLILIFFSVGFFIPLYAIIQCYLSVITDFEGTVQTSNIKEEDPSEDEEPFENMKSPSTGFFTMILSIMEGKLTYSEDIYDISNDSTTHVFFLLIMFFYFLIFGLLCFNLLIALISNRYAMMMENKNRDWQFAKFDLLVDYLCVESKFDDVDNANHIECNDGMPFFFPFCLVYVPLRLFVKSRRKRTCRKINQAKDPIVKEIETHNLDTMNGEDPVASDKLVQQLDETSDVRLDINSKRKDTISTVLERRKNRLNRATLTD